MSIVDRVLREQRDLRTLTGPKLDYRTSEWYTPNDNYGIANTLKRYSGYSKNKPIRAVIPHGIYLPVPVFVGEVNTPIRSVLSWQPQVDEFYAAAGMNVVPVAAPFYYAMQTTDLPNNGPEPQGTLFFPAHSTAAVDTVFDWTAVADLVEGLPDEFKPVTICVYWHDYALGRFDEFEQRGFRLVSCGHLSDRDFMVRLYVLLKQHRFAGSNELGSGLFYSVAADVPYFLIGEGASVQAKTAEFAHVEREYPAAEEFMARTRALFSELSQTISDEQRAFVGEHLRADCLEDPASLRKKLEALPQVAPRY